MKNLLSAAVAAVLLTSTSLIAQQVPFTKETLEPHLVSMELVKQTGKNAVKVVKDSSVKLFDEPTFVKVKDVNFSNGTIEVKVLSKLLKNAPAMARGFIGIAFRISEDNSKFESIYIRPTNGRADDQVRRNHSIQYYSYPNYKFDRLRKEAPEKYESYADMELNKWITMRIEINGQHASLYLDGSPQPVLVVNDLFHGSQATGAIGLWVEVGTEGYFSDLKVTK